MNKKSLLKKVGMMFLATVLLAGCGGKGGKAPAAGGAKKAAVKWPTKNVTVILITHYMEEVVDADKIFVMDHGKVVMEGTPKEIFSRVDELKSYRLDVPQVTILADELRKRGLDIPKGILRKEELVEAITHLQQ